MAKGRKPIKSLRGKKEARCLVVSSLKDLTDLQVSRIHSIERVRRRPRKGATLETAYKVTLYSDRAEKLLRLRGEVLQMLEKLRAHGIDPLSASRNTESRKTRG